MLKRFINWCLAINDIHSTTVIKKSITGEPLVQWEHGDWFKPMLLRNTPLDTKATFLLSNIKMDFGTSINAAKAVLRGEHDNCLDQNCKDEIIEVIKTVIKQGGYGALARTKSGVLEVKSFYLDPKDSDELKELLRASYSG